LIKKLITIFIVFALFSCAACEKSAVNDGKIKVIYSIYAYGEIARAIGGDSIAAVSFIPEGTEAHDFEPSSRNMASVRDADILIYSDLTDSAWFDVVKNVCDKAGTKTVNISEDIETIELDGGGVDPHFWLSLKNAEIMAVNVKNALSESYPAGVDGFERNLNVFIETSVRLRSDYTDKYRSLQNTVFICDHAAFGYLCAEFGLLQKSVTGAFDGGEPSAKELAELIDFCRANSIHTIFMEYGTDESVMTTLANEFDGNVSVVYTLESSGGDSADSYIDTMFSNLDIIYEGLTK
jgi:zinc transport system substrate-binding protein